MAKKPTKPDKTFSKEFTVRSVGEMSRVETGKRNTTVGYYWVEGIGKYHAFDHEKKYLGVFPTQQDAKSEIQDVWKGKK